jgi:tetratricopeptide (TPR) repeat protein
MIKPTASVDLRLLSYALGNLGSLYRLEGRLNEALLLTRRALSKAEAAQAPDSIYRWHWQEVQLLREQEKHRQAIDAYRHSSQQASLARYDSVDIYFRNEYVLKFSAQQQSLDNISDTTTVVYPIILPKRLEILLSLLVQNSSGQHKLQRYSVPIDSSQLARRVQQFCLQLEYQSKPSRFLQDSQWLYRLLIVAVAKNHFIPFFYP